MRSQYETLDVLAPVSAHEWMREAACLGHPADLWFPEKPTPNLSNEWLAERSAQAKAICASCPVRLECLTLGMAEESGIWGGVDRSPAARKNQHSQKTHCIRGHEFTPENTRHRKTGARVCRACEREASLARSTRRPPEGGVCKHGHPYTEETTYLDPKGLRKCRTCARAHDQKYREQQRSDAA